MKELFSPLPKTKYVNQKLNKFSTDINPNAPFVNYHFNEYGYRSEGFVRSEVNVLTIGCSVAFGNGIPSENRFSAIFCNLLQASLQKSISDWNIAWPGESVDYIGRMLPLFLPFLKPEILIVSFPSFCRKEFFDAFGSRYDFRPDRKDSNAISKNIHQHLLALTSDYQDLANFFRTFKMIDYMCKYLGIKWLYSIRKHDESLFTKINQFDTIIKIDSLDKIDVARDGGHPGILSNKNFGEKIFKKYMEIYYEKTN
jgi:hypothetical protein